MKTSLSQSQLGVYYACVANKDKSVNYQNALLVALPSVIDLNRFRKAVYEALGVDTDAKAAIMDYTSKALGCAAKAVDGIRFEMLRRFAQKLVGRTK